MRGLSEVGSLMQIGGKVNQDSDYEYSGWTTARKGGQASVPGIPLSHHHEAKRMSPNYLKGSDKGESGKASPAGTGASMVLRIMETVA